MKYRMFGVTGLIVALVSCMQHEGEPALVLPPTPVLQLATRWAVVDVPVLRLRDAPTKAGSVLSSLSAGARVEVLTQTANEVEVDGRTDHWYQVNHNGTRGWMFGAYITEVTVSATHANGRRSRSVPSIRPDQAAGS